MAVFGFCRGGVHALMAARAHEEIRVIVVFHGFAFRPARSEPGAQPYDLAEGDSVTFDADLPHHFENPDGSEARFFAVVAAGLRRS